MAGRQEAIAGNHPHNVKGPMTANDSVIPDVKAEDAKDNIENWSPARKAAHHQVELAAFAVHGFGNMSIRMSEAMKGHEVMAFLDGIYAEKCAKLDSVIASEMLGTPVNVTNGSKISLAPEAS